MTIDKEVTGEFTKFFKHNPDLVSFLTEQNISLEEATEYLREKRREHVENKPRGIVVSANRFFLASLTLTYAEVVCPDYYDDFGWRKGPANAYCKYLQPEKFKAQQDLMDRYKNFVRNRGKRALLDIGDQVSNSASIIGDDRDTKRYRDTLKHRKFAL